MSTHFITNQEKLLADVVNNVLPSAKRLYFLIGYFYFSGFEEIYKQVADKEVKILVGLEIERDLANRIKEFQVIQEVNVPRGKIRENYALATGGQSYGYQTPASYNLEVWNSPFGLMSSNVP